VARLDKYQGAIGIDLEPATPLPGELWDAVLLPCERSQIEGFELEPGVIARIFFSAKEAAFKCQYTVTRRFLEFHDISIRLEPNLAAFAAELPRNLAPMIGARSVRGRLRLARGHVACAAEVTAPKFSIAEVSEYGAAKCVQSSIASTTSLSMRCL
jgi:4'-phosphopantetheinyl transferase EntD